MLTNHSSRGPQSLSAAKGFVDEGVSRPSVHLLLLIQSVEEPGRGSQQCPMLFDDLEAPVRLLDMLQI